MDFRPFDRLPMIEWAHWWDKTITRWHTEGLPAEQSDRYDLYRHFGLDMYYQDWIAPWPPAPAQHGGAVVESDADYDKLRQTIYPPNPVDLVRWERWAKEQQAGDAVLWFTLDGFFWYPRKLLGIENHLYAFYDQPELMNRINEDLLTFSLRVIDQICSVTTPDFMTFGEDMSYNHGPMLSQDLFEQFIAPFYQRIVPELKRRGIRVIVDSDGDITIPTAWFRDAGVEGLLPLERQAGVDMAHMRQLYPSMRFIGHYDKMVMNKGTDAMRAEFERILPVAAQGGFLPSVDHQTPPGVSYSQYLDYLKLFEEYAWKAGKLSQDILA
jgi:Uroporphyrinogen decarboxylase (URO-D)